MARAAIAEIEAELAMPPFPASLGFVWQAYFRLRRRKAGGMAGPAPLEWPDIDAFRRNGGAYLPPWTIPLIEDIDDIYLSATSAEAASASEQRQGIKDGLQASAREFRSVKSGRGG